jgi:predicted alpha/beta hydrolase family esterase
MINQVLVIHGGTTFESNEEYLKYLNLKETSIEKLTYKDWKANLQDDLGPNFLVISPRMPNSMNSRYPEWKIWFEKVLALLDESPILIGHSLGAIFLAKYFSENTANKSIKAVFLVAPPLNDNPLETLADFRLQKDLSLFAKQIPKIYIFQSKDDPVVPYTDALEYQKLLPNCELTIFEDRQHFNGESFPEIVEKIKSIVN